MNALGVARTPDDSPAAVSVFVTDDHPVVAQGIALTLDGTDDLRFVGAASSLAEAVSAVRRLQPDVVLLDVRLPGSDVVTAVDVLRAATPSVIVLFTADPRHPQVPTALRHGAVATLTKDTPPEQMRRAIRAVARGESVTAPTTDERLLTDRQHDVLRLVAAGMTNGEIAAELGIAVTTVKAYWQETMQRLGVRNRAEAIVAAYRGGIL